MHRIQCSLPVLGVKTNVYFSSEPTPTLIDAPPEGKRYLKELDDGLRAIGHSISDIRRIIITHSHFDHYGAARTIKEITGAEVWASKNAARCIEDYDRVLLDQRNYRTLLLEKAGAPAVEINYINDYYREANRFAQSTKISRRLKNGDVFKLANLSFVVYNIPGHTPGCILMFNAENGFAFTGDFLAHDSLSKPLVQWTDLSCPSYKTLKSYVGSLKKVRDINLRFALPGHGKVIDSPKKRIDDILDSISERRRAILRILSKGTRTLFEIMSDLFPCQGREHLFRSICDIVGHLELLEEAGLIEKMGGHPIRFYSV